MSHQNNIGGRQAGTMGESTRQRLAGLIQVAKSGDAAAAGMDRPRTPGAYVGGFQGGLAGTWGKAATGRSGPASSAQARNPLLGGQAPRPSAALVEARQAEIAREYHPKPDRVRPASSGARNIWDVLPPKGSASSTRRQQHLSAVRPRTAGPRLQQQLQQQQQQFGFQGTDHPGRQAPDDYKLRGSALGAAAIGRATNPAHHLGFDSGSSLDALPDASAIRASAAGFSFAAATVPAGHEAGAPEKAGQQLGRQHISQSGPGAGAGGVAAAELTEARLAALDDAIRDAVRNRRSVYEDSKALLLKLFKEVDDGSGDVDVEEFCGVCGKLGVAVNVPEAAALFRRAGFDGVMPYQKWAHNLINQPSRKIAQESSVRKGAFLPGQSANFNGKIIYEECRKPVWTPSDWDPRLADKSAELPDVRLNLEFAYGYAGGQTTSQNLFYNCSGHAVYIVAGLGVVYQQPPVHKQQFFLGHNDDVKSLAICPAAVLVGEQNYPAYSLVATGQVSSRTGGPVICLWDSRVGSLPASAAAAGGASAAVGPHAEVSRLQMDKEMRGIVALGFSPDGTMLASVATDNSHTVTVYDWRSGARLGEGKGCMGEPTQVFGLEWNTHQLTHDVGPQFVTFGKKHIKIWKTAPTGNTWTATQLSFGKLPLQNVCSAAFLRPQGARSESLVVGGMADGQVYVFKGTAAISSIAAHKPGPKIIQPDGQPAYEGLRGMRLCRQGTTLLTGGADGVLMQWDVADGSLVDGRFAGPAMNLASSCGDKAPVIRSLDYLDQATPSNQSHGSGNVSGSILVGTVDSCIREVAASGGCQEVLVSGHAHDVWAVAFHPQQPHIAATVCDGNKVWVWDLAARLLLRSASVGFVCRSVQFSSIGYGAGTGFHIAVGGAKGHIRVVTESELCPVWEGRDSTQGISELDYSPDGKLLAAATFDAWIDVYNVEKGYQRIARCSGHSATVRTIDWSVDSSILQSNCAAREILYWNARSGKQVPGSCRDIQWSGWTCLYGFPVMGIWPDTADGSDINSCDRSKSGRYLATSDDYGLVKLFNYPVVIEDAPHRAYRGHSSHVTCVRFNANDSLVCSTGGKDWAMFQFRVAPVDSSTGVEEGAAGGGAVGGAGAAANVAAAAAAAARKGGVKAAGPEMVWGPYDASGKMFGWIPAEKAAAAISAAAANTSAVLSVTTAAYSSVGVSSIDQQQQDTTAAACQSSAQSQQQQQQQSQAVHLPGQRLPQQPSSKRYVVAGQEAVGVDDDDEVDLLDEE